ncbi:MAG: 50S ribosomal protein L10 [Betaproteobacteria bacterium]
MGLNLDEKKALVVEISGKVSQSQAIVLAEYRSMEVGEITKLRAKARDAGVYFRVLKNTLARRAVQDTPFAGLAEHMIGPLVYGMSSDPVAVAKVISDFAKGNDKLVIKAAGMPNHVLSAKEVASLASLPSREILLATLLGTLQAPIAKFAQTLNEVPSKFARVLAARREQMEKQAA